MRVLLGMISNYLYKLKQNEVFENIKGIWIGNYEHESGITLEQIVKDVLDKEYSFPIIKSDNFGHGLLKTVIPIGTKAKIDTKKEQKIELIEKPLI
jgi:muramoyltetrapeptide carboxypeptidase